MQKVQQHKFPKFLKKANKVKKSKSALSFQFIYGNRK